MKRRYLVDVTETYTARIEVMAESPDDAEWEADNLVGGEVVDIVELPLARPLQFVLTQSGLRPGEGRRTGGSRRALCPHRSRARSHLALGRVPFLGNLTRKNCSRNERSTPPATLPLPREAALCFIKKHQGQDEGIRLRSHQTSGGMVRTRAVPGRCWKRNLTVFDRETSDCHD